jgi:hypothetical protein
MAGDDPSIPEVQNPDGSWTLPHNIQTVGGDPSIPEVQNSDGSWTLPQGAQTAPAGSWYTMQAGDSLWGVAGGDRALFGAMLQQNNIPNANNIQAGAQVWVPSSDNFSSNSDAVGNNFFVQQAAAVQARLNAAAPTQQASTSGSQPSDAGSLPTVSGLQSMAAQLQSNANVLNNASSWAYSQGDSASGATYRQMAITAANASSIYSNSALNLAASQQSGYMGSDSIYMLKSTHHGPTPPLLRQRRSAAYHLARQ